MPSVLVTPTWESVVLSQCADEAYAFDLLKDGAAGLGYLLKDRVSDTESLVRASRAVRATRSR